MGMPLLLAALVTASPQLPSPPPVQVPQSIAPALLAYLHCLQPTVARIANETDAARMRHMHSVVVKAEAECAVEREHDRIQALELIKAEKNVPENDRAWWVDRAFAGLDAQLAQFGDASDTRQGGQPNDSTERQN